MRQEKSLLLKEVQDKIVGSKAFFITRYNALEPNQSCKFRLHISNTGGELEVVKKRILIKAADAAGIKLDEALLDGHISVIFANQDAIQTTKAIFDFSKESEEMGLVVVSGSFEGQMCTAKDIEAIAKLPTKDEMRAQLLSVFEAPLSQTLAVFEALLTSVVYCLDNKAKQES